MILSNFSQAIGNTPLVKINNLLKNETKIYAKVESMNPLSSIKDRAALFMIEEAEKRGSLTTGTVIIEPTSGNTGIGLAYISAIKGYKTIFTMPESMSVERRKLLKAFGAEIVLTDASKGMQGAIEKAKELFNKSEKAFIPSQFDNKDNPLAHYKTTGPEIYNDLKGEIDFLISAVGTGGTLSGCGRYLKEKIPEIKIIAVEPANSAVISGKQKGSHGIQGIGAGFIPSNLDKSIIDSVITISTEESYEMARRVAKEEGILLGISSGAALAAAIKIASDVKNKNKTIVVICPDSGERYLSTSLYD